jgi:transcriptional regulator with XRE-family HTH domain
MMMKTTAKGSPKQRLAAERMRRRWTQLEVADQLGTTPGNVSRWERGITSPGPYFRRKLCELFGRSAHELGLAWDASRDLPTQMPTSNIVALKEVQANHGRGGKGSVQTAIESASCSRDGSSTVPLVKANSREMRGEGLALLADGLNRPEHGQERIVRLHIHPDWVLILDTVVEIRLVVDVLLQH